jgi:hypothetical protein
MAAAGHTPHCDCGKAGLKAVCPLCRAAPDLLAALKEGVSWLCSLNDGEPGLKTAIDACDAAIAKAEGAQ